MNYRPEIDGLRGVAVLSVVLFHAEIYGFDGGYIGVDVFFVISGFLITSILQSDIRANRFSILKFYNHRARRILPALIAVLLVMTVFSRQWMLPWQFDEYAKSAIAALTFWSNIFFWRTSGYFDVGTDEKPLLHTWSLGVEEQFNLLFPIMFFWFWRYGHKRTLQLVIIFLLLSLVVAEWGWRNKPQPNFFLTPTRGWELLLGAASALIGPVALSRNLRDGLSFLGLVAILGSVVFLSKHYPTPSVYLLPALLGAAIILRCATQDTLTARFLSFRPLLAVGIVSYSFYLWHQPVFALYRIRFGELDASAMSVVLMALSLALAVLTYWLVETPFRRRTSTGFQIGNRIALPAVTAGTAGLLLASAYFVLEIQNGYFRSEKIVFNDATVNTYEARIETWELYVHNPAIANELSHFQSSDDQRKRVLIVGDSHAKDLFNALKQNEDLFDDFEFRVAFFRDGCMLPSPPRTIEFTGKCLTEFSKKHAKLVNSATHVLFSINWNLTGPSELKETVTTATEFFQGKGKDVVLTSTSSVFRPGSPFLIAKLFREHKLTKAESDRLHYAHLIPGVKEVDEIIRTVATNTGALYLSKLDYICADELSSCHSLTPTGHAIFPDGGHYTVEGARFFGKRIAELGWLSALQ